MKSNRSLIKSLFGVLLGLLAFVGTLSAQDKGAGHRIIFQLTDDDHRSQKSLVGQLTNLTEGWPEAEIEVVCHSAGITFLQKGKTEFSSEIKMLSQRGVDFRACENTLLSHDLSKDDILETAGFVPMGIAEIVKKQEAGWSYIKAGL